MFFTRSARPDRPGRRLRLESLEPRLALSGNVTVDFTAGVLQVTGDAEDNQVQLVSDGTNIAILGIETTITGPASVNRAATTTINIVLAEGDDNIALLARNNANSGFTPVNLTVDTGDNDDTVLLSAENSAGFGFLGNNLTVDSGEGDDVVTLIAKNTGGTGFSYNGNMLVDSGGGDDKVTLKAAGTGNFGFRSFGNLTIDSGDNDDKITVQAANKSGFGFTFNDFVVQAGSGNDKVTLKTKKNIAGFAVGGSVTLDGGDGKDVLKNKVFGPGATVLNFEKT